MGFRGLKTIVALLLLPVIFLLITDKASGQDHRLTIGYAHQSYNINYVSNEAYDGRVMFPRKGALEIEYERYFFYRLYSGVKADYLVQNEESFIFGGPVNFRNSNLTASLGYQGDTWGIHTGIRAGRLWGIRFRAESNGIGRDWIDAQGGDEWTAAYTAGIKYYLRSFLRLNFEFSRSLLNPGLLQPQQEAAATPNVRAIEFKPYQFSVGISFGFPWNSRSRVERLNDPANLPPLRSLGDLELGSPMFETVVTSPFGPRWTTQHQGVDLDASRGDKILAAADGIVSFAGTMSGYGKTVQVEHGSGYSTLYAHLDEITIRNGVRVNKGDLLGYAGETGRATGIHLHFEIRRNGERFDPMQYIRF